MSFSEIFGATELGLIYGILAIGVYLTFRVIDFPDLTVDGSFVFGAAACAVALKAGLSPMLALCLAGLSGAIAGCVTGILHVYCQMTRLLAGILTAFIFYSLNLRLMGPNISLFQVDTIFTQRSAWAVLGVIVICVWGAISYLLSTQWGLALRSVGQNQNLARAYGVSVPLMIFVALSLSNALVGFAGGLFCQSQNFADISMGAGSVIVGLAAVMIGEKLLPNRSVPVALLACVLGSILYRIFIAAALHSDFLGLRSSDLNVITGLLIVSLMLLTRRRGGQPC